MLGIGRWWNKPQAFSADANTVLNAAVEGWVWPTRYPGIRDSSDR